MTAADESALALDHVGVITRDLVQGARCWERLGFTLAPLSRQRGAVPGRDGMHPWASANRCAIFRRGYLELIGIVDASAFNPWRRDSAFAVMAKERAEALFVVTDPAYVAHRARLVQLSATHRLPSMFTQRGDAEAGGLMSYGPSFPDMYRRAAAFVDKILKGTKPADLPIEQPTRFEFVVNLKTAKALGLTIPSSLVTWADHVIE